MNKITLCSFAKLICWHSTISDQRNDYFSSFSSSCWFHHDFGLYGDLGCQVLVLPFWNLGILFILRSNWFLLAIMTPRLRCCLQPAQVFHFSWKCSYSSYSSSYRGEKGEVSLSGTWSWGCLPLPSWIEDEWEMIGDKEEWIDNRFGIASWSQAPAWGEERTVFLCGQ